MNVENSGCKGLLVTNAFLRTGKFVEHYEWLREAAVRCGMSLHMTVRFCGQTGHSGL